LQPASRPLVDAAANLRRSMLVGAALGIASIVVLALIGHPLAGVFVCIGLGFGAANNWLLQRSVMRYAADEHLPKGKFSRGVFLRLVAITAVAAGVALLFRPDGLGIFAGLAVFQILMLVGAALPVFRSLRPTS
jgi:ATP synthase I chain